MFFYGTIQDKLGTKRTLAILIGVIATLVGPFVIYVYRPLLESNFMVGVIVGGVFLSAGFMAGLLKMPTLWAVILFVIGTGTFYNLFDQQMFPDFYTGIFANKDTGQQVYGVLNSAQVFLDAAMMVGISILIRKVGVRTSLLLASRSRPFASWVARSSSTRSSFQA